MSYSVPADASTPLIDLWMCIILLTFALTGVLILLVDWLLPPEYDPRGDDEACQEPPLFRRRSCSDEPEDLLDDAEHWRDR